MCIRDSDYMVKPIDMDEMLLRVAALLRRANIANEHKLQLGDGVLLDYDSLTVRAHGKLFELPQQEFYLLFQLLSYPKKIFTRQQLMDEIWGMDAEADERTVDVHITVSYTHLDVYKRQGSWLVPASLTLTPQLKKHTMKALERDVKHGQEKTCQ